MLDAFASVGAHHFDLTLTDAAGHKVEFRPGLTIEELRPALPQFAIMAGTFAALELVVTGTVTFAAHTAAPLLARAAMVQRVQRAGGAVCCQ